MNLPQIAIPAVNIPFDIPTLIHPAVAHFAIAIPVLVVIAEIFNLFINGKGIKIMSSLFMFLLVGIFFVMYLTGVADGKMAIDNGFGAVSELKEHKLLGIYIFYGSIFMFFLKLISLAVSKKGFKAFYILVLIGFLAAVLHQGKEGGELVYKHGANVQMQKDGFEDDEEEKTSTSTTTQEVKKESKNEKISEEKPANTESHKNAEEKKSIIDTAKQEVKDVTHEAEKEVAEVKEKIEETAQKLTETNSTESH